MQDHSPLSPEERRKQLASLSAAYGPDAAKKLADQFFTTFKKEVSAGSGAVGT